MEVSKAPQSQDSKLHFLDYWRIIRIRKAVILAVFLLVVITTAIITQFQPESYSSQARMRVEKDTPLTQLMMGSGPMTPAFDQYFLQTEFQVIRSPKILNEVIKDLKLGGGSQVLKGGSKSKPIKLVDGDHEISCKVDGIAVGLKACFVKKA